MKVHHQVQPQAERDGVSQGFILGSKSSRELVTGKEYLGFSDFNPGAFFLAPGGFPKHNQ